MTIKTKRVYDNSEASDGYRVVVMRHRPRFLKKGSYNRWMQELSPSAPLLKSYLTRMIDWDTFTSGYHQEMKSNPVSQQAIHELREKSKVTDVTLLCHEKDGENCHRYLLKNLIDLE
jgi:uncharacterized protein YeaO (DUF488 family)